MLIYNLEFFTNIYEQPIVLSGEIINIINKLHSELHIHPVTDVKKVKRPKKSTDNLKNIDFKCTVIKKIEGDAKIISDIRSALNKLSESKYNIQLEAILGNISILVTNNNSKDITNIMELILDISCGNSSLSKIYAKLWKDLTNVYNEHEYIKLIFNRYDELLSNIETVDPAIDYDKFCKINKINDKRKNVSLFIVNLLKEDLITLSRCMNIVNDVIEEINSNIIDNIPAYKNDELIEVLNVFIINGQSILNTSSDWINVETFIKDISSKTIKELNSISSRSLFKFMDIRDKFF
tara:strand:+ start:7254 stop:8135 length:882 start_codon:yes stop_codon:yes gene_type:complete